MSASRRGGDRWRRDRGDQFAGGKTCGRLRSVLVAGQQHRGHRDRLDDWAGHGPLAQAFKGNNQIHGMCPDAVVLLGYREGGDAEFGERGPHRQAGAVITRGPGTRRGRNIGHRQRRVDAGGEVALLGVQIEFHLAPPVRALSLGSPRMRSAMILR